MTAAAKRLKTRTIRGCAFIHTSKMLDRASVEVARTMQSDMEQRLLAVLPEATLEKVCAVAEGRSRARL